MASFPRVRKTVLMPQKTKAPELAVQSRFWLTAGRHSLAGRGRIELLERIAETGSIRQAAVAMGMSYRAAWDAVDAMNTRAGTALVERRVGGARGGGAVLSAHGEALVSLFKNVEIEHARLIEQLNRKIQTLRTTDPAP